MRSGFSMLTAIGIVVLIATVMSLMLMLTTTSADKTANIYLKEQTHLIARSATEYALLAASGHDFSSSCLEEIDMEFDDSDYEVSMKLYYIGNGLQCNPDHILANNIATADSNGTVIIDTVVTYPLTNDQNVSYARRTLQKL